MARTHLHEMVQKITMNFRRSDNQWTLVFQVTSMVDIMLVLVVFLLFGFATGVKESELDVRVPGANNAGPQTNPSRIVVNMLKSGRIVLNGREMNADALKDILAKLVTNDPHLSVIVRADKASSYESVLGIVDLCQGVNVESVGFAALKN